MIVAFSSIKLKVHQVNPITVGYQDQGHHNNGWKYRLYQYHQKLNDVEIAEERVKQQVLKWKDFYLQSPRLLGLSDGLNESGCSKSLNATVPQASGRAAIPKKLKGMLRYVVIQAQNRRDFNDLHVGPEVVHRHRGGRGRGSIRGFKYPLELGEVTGEREGGAEGEGAGLQGPGGEGGDETRRLEGVSLGVVPGSGGEV